VGKKFTEGRNRLTTGLTGGDYLLKGFVKSTAGISQLEVLRYRLVEITTKKPSAPPILDRGFGARTKKDHSCGGGRRVVAMPGSGVRLLSLLKISTGEKGSQLWGGEAQRLRGQTPVDDGRGLERCGKSPPEKEGDCKFEENSWRISQLNEPFLPKTSPFKGGERRGKKKKRGLCENKQLHVSPRKKGDLKLN